MSGEVVGNEAFRARFAPNAIVFKSIMKDVAYLSNFAELSPPISVSLLDGAPRSFPTVEHYYQAAKAVHLGLPAYGEIIRRAATPLDAKKLGGAAGMAAYVDANMDSLPVGVQLEMRPVRKLGDKRKRQAAIKAILKSSMGGFDHANVMRTALRLKFDAQRDAALVQRLLDTQDAVLGESRGRKDDVWAINVKGDPGLLGTLLMERRRELRAAASV
jgi:predicted NAD-dependent protein-ADP-ribosyltransferase YbiA (DUF1768 family)